MMKSVALSESVAHDPQGEDDFVLVPEPVVESTLWELSFDDDASYDRCEDAYSIYSAPQSLAIDSNALQSFQKSFFGNSNAPHYSMFHNDDDPSCDEGAEILLRGISTMALSPGAVPDLKVENLSDVSIAIESPDDRLLQPIDASIESSVSGTSSTDIELDVAHGKAASTAYRASCSMGKSDLESIDAEQQVCSESKSTTTTLMIHLDRLTVDDDDEDVTSTCHDTLLAADEAAVKNTGSTKTARLCNKKRRKQLKLAKKAAAAAAAAAALTHIGGMVTTRTASSSSTTTTRGGGGESRSKFKRQSTPKNNRKQVANIAVACATESIARYKEECLQMNQK